MVLTIDPTETAAEKLVALTRRTAKEAAGLSERNLLSRVGAGEGAWAMGWEGWVGVWPMWTKRTAP